MSPKNYFKYIMYVCNCIQDPSLTKNILPAYNLKSEYLSEFEFLFENV